MSGFVEDIQRNFKDGNMVVKLIYVNVAVFVVLLILGLVGGLFTPMAVHPGLAASMSEWAEWLMMHSKLSELVFKPWTLITHMFTHVDVFHLLFNMLMLYFSGQLFVRFFGEKKLLSIYLMGGLAGAAALIIASAFLPYFEGGSSMALGASAAVMSIFIACCVYAPKMIVNLFGIFPLELRYLGLIIFGLDLVKFYDGNTGGHIAHIAGSAFGFFMAKQYIQGKDITRGFARALETMSSWFKKKDNSLYVSHSKVRKMKDEDYNFSKTKMQEKVDQILDKIGRSGYESLSKEEKEFLNKSSRQ